MAGRTSIGLTTSEPPRARDSTNSRSNGPLSPETGRCQKLPDQLLETFIKSFLAFARKAREQATSNQVLDRLNQIHHLAKPTIAANITLNQLGSADEEERQDQEAKTEERVDAADVDFSVGILVGVYD
ncbi:hypothetical protein DL98DRAFT_619634 [Cadophora sp. DSE1049]|nr:hypothetical protein DL98DRAFT_619634 [Cadophora sp. DSE1049]